MFDCTVSCIFEKIPFYFQKKDTQTFRLIILMNGHCLKTFFRLAEILLFPFELNGVKMLASRNIIYCISECVFVSGVELTCPASVLVLGFDS